MRDFISYLYFLAQTTRAQLMGMRDIDFSCRQTKNEEMKQFYSGYNYMLFCEHPAYVFLGAKSLTRASFLTKFGSLLVEFLTTQH